MTSYASGQLPSSNLNIEDVRDTLGETSLNVATLCKSSKINPWALWRPIPSPSLSILSYDDRVASNNGFTAKQMTVNFILNNQPSTITPQRWESRRPSGGVSSPYRLADFTDGIGKTGGYVHQAVPPDVWGSGEHSGDSFDASKTPTITLVNNVITLPANKSIPFQNMNIRLGIASAEAIGSVTYKNLPLKACATLTDDSRIGMLVKLNYLLTGTASSNWFLFTSRRALSTFSGTTDVQYMLPDFYSNPLLCQCLYYAYQNKQLRDVQLIPCICSGLTEQRATYNGVTYSYLQAAAIYSMPSGQGEINYHILSHDLVPCTSPYGTSTYTPTYSINAGGAVIGIQASFSGSYQHIDSTYVPINAIWLGIWQSELDRMTADSVRVQVDYKYQQYGSTTQYSASSTWTFYKASVSDVDSKYITTIRTAPGLGLISATFKVL